MKEQAIKILDSKGTADAIEFLQAGQADLSPAGQVHAFNGVMRHAYWEDKDLSAAIQLGEAGLAMGKKLLEQHPDQTSDLKSEIKALQYNLASFTWPGWDEEGISITPEQVKLGLRAAEENLIMAMELNKEDLALSRAYWMLAAQELANRKYKKAAEHFGQAEMLANKVDVPGEALLALGFIQVVGLLQEPENEVYSKKLDEIKTVLGKEEHGKFFVAQLVDALRLFQS